MTRRSKLAIVAACCSLLTTNACVSVNARPLARSAPPPLLDLAIRSDDDGGYRLVEQRAPARVLTAGTLEHCEQSRLALLRERLGEDRPNLVFPTLGGKQLWADVFVHCGWRIQINHYTRHHRLLDPDDARRAWGSYDSCRVAFEEERLARGLAPQGRHAVVLVHGWVRSKASLSTMAKALERRGFEVVLFGYPSSRAPLHAHARQLERVLDDLSEVERVSFVTHSLGGPVVRTLLSFPGRSDGWRQRLEVGRLVMLFPPSQGAYLSESWGDNPLYRTFGGEVGQELRPERARGIPLPGCSFAIIAGGRGDGQGRNARIPGDDDGTVAVAEAWLPGADAFRVLDVGHTFGMSDPRLVDLTIGYLETGDMP